LLPPADGAFWACADIANAVIRETSGRTIPDRLILANPFLANPIWRTGQHDLTPKAARQRVLMTRTALLTGKTRRVLLQISKIATILRQVCGLRIGESPARLTLSRRLDDVAIGAPRHHAILQSAGRGQIARKPDSNREQDGGDHEACDRAATVIGFGLSVLYGIGHRAVRDIQRRAASTMTAQLASHLVTSGPVQTRRISATWKMERWLAGAVWLTRWHVVRMPTERWHCQSAPSAGLATGLG
jgi:hypothetical protein